MELLASPALWLVLALSVAIPVLFIVGARRLALRMVDRPTAMTASLPKFLPAPRLRAPSLRWLLTRGLLLTLIGTGLGIIMLRFVYGLSAVTNLSDQFAWGLWISFDVMCGVALAAGAFVIAATVHIFRLERFEPLVRPAILTGLLGYLLVVAGLIVDLGRPYNVWRPLFHWQHHSVLWEVGVCVATYTTVLLIEFLPVVLEKVNHFEAVTTRLPTVKLTQLLKKVSIAFVIMGVVLSTLHQSSLGSLWVLMPTKVSPLWYSLYLPVFFWMSAIAVGLAMTIVESTLSSKAFNRGLETHLLVDLAKAAAVVLAIYLAVRAIDLVVRGAWPLMFEPTLQAASFWAEIGLGVMLPIVLFSIRPLRQRHGVLFLGAVLIVVFGVVLNRFNVSLIGLLPYTGQIYTPSWMELVVTMTLVSLGVIAFGLAAKYLPVFHEEEHEASR
ncbi:MAG: Ni/Fe-hydrogenase cytochrome b subunit [Chloroflexota bacterium]|nr:Ni/Fe-hydrogenase cytochrome b subunit [Chloroflexota bacterium]